MRHRRPLFKHRSSRAGLANGFTPSPRGFGRPWPVILVSLAALLSGVVFGCQTEAPATDEVPDEVWAVLKGYWNAEDHHARHQYICYRERITPEDLRAEDARCGIDDAKASPFFQSEETAHVTRRTPWRYRARRMDQHRSGVDVLFDKGRWCIDWTTNKKVFNRFASERFANLPVSQEDHFVAVSVINREQIPANVNGPEGACFFKSYHAPVSTIRPLQETTFYLVLDPSEVKAPSCAELKQLGVFFARIRASPGPSQLDSVVERLEVIAEVPPSLSARVFSYRNR